jgi:hypothetical protein
MIVKQKRKIIPVMIIIASLVLLAFSSGNNNKNRLNKPTNINAGLTYLVQVNKLVMPIDNAGVLANVDLGTIGDGQYDGKGILFSGGFMLTGKDGGELWSNGVATASRIQDYVGGVVGMDQNDPKAHIYVVKTSDEPFGDSWLEWKDAVDMGAYFYDGDGDDVYNPVDKNGNGEWDQDEDKPDLLGDETIWCVYNDGLERSLRAFTDQDPRGIEIRQTLWGYATSGDFGNILFIRYSINNAGTVADRYDSVYFSVWDDVDLGGSNGYGDDLIGCDTTLSAGFTYNDGPDPTYGVDPPCFLVDFFQGPWVETGNPEDLAFNTKGPLLGIDTIPGALNLPLTSFVHYEQSVGDPDNAQQLRNYLLGETQYGAPNDPCATDDQGDLFGTILGGVDCSTIPPQFMYSGDPVTQIGWINNYPTDQRQLANTGPFILEKDKPVDIIAAYVVGRSTSALNSVVLAKKIDRTAQFGFSNNFNIPSPPPAVSPVIKTTDNTIELIWNTSSQVNYRRVGQGYDMMFESYDVYMHQTNSLSEQEGGKQNTTLIASYDVANDIKKVLLEDPVSLERSIIYDGGTQLDSATYGSSTTGRISLTISTDPFTNGPLIKGKPYFISIVPTAYNRDDIVRLDALGNYMIPKTSAVGNVVGLPVILSDGVSSVGIVPGKDTYTPYYVGVEADHNQGGSDATVTYDVKNRTLSEGHENEVSFFTDDSSDLYSLYYRITDLSNGDIKLDSSKQYGTGLINDLVSGAVVNVEWIEPGVESYEYEGDGPQWFSLLQKSDSVGIFYMGTDVDDPNGLVTAVANVKSKITKVPDMKRVEIRFGQTGKAYRYMKGLSTFRYAGDSGWVDVPFQAWVKDDALGLEYQLAVGFTESALILDTLANPDGKYDPGFSVWDSKEYIVIFNAPYDPTGQQYVYTGNSSSWANISNGYRLRDNDPRYTSEDSAIAKSPFFNALYVAGLQRTGDANTPMTGTCVINISRPLTPSDRYQFVVNNDLTSTEEKDLFDKINVFPNPLFAYNPGVSYTGGSADSPYITFSNLPNVATIKIFTISGNLIRTLEKNDNSPFMTWDLLNQDNLRIASGMYIAIVSVPNMGDKVLKFAIIQPQKQILKY